MKHVDDDNTARQPDMIQQITYNYDNSPKVRVVTLCTTKFKT